MRLPAGHTRARAPAPPHGTPFMLRPTSALGSAQHASSEPPSAEVPTALRTGYLWCCCPHAALLAARTCAWLHVHFKRNGGLTATGCQCMHGCMAAEAEGLSGIATRDWSEEVAPFWRAVIQTALSGAGLAGLLQAGWTTIKVRCGHVAAHMHAAGTGTGGGYACCTGCTGSSWLGCCRHVMLTAGTCVAQAAAASLACACVPLAC